MKTRILILILSLFATFASFSVAAKTHSTKPKLDKTINAILDEFGENLNIGILIEDASSGKVLYSKNADRYFMPASNEKLFTAWAALNYLGANFVYQTQLFVDNTKLQNGILNDNVYLTFSGDPTLTFAQLDQLIASLSQAGIKQINGHVIINDTAFDDVAMSPGTTWDDQKYCWGAPISSLILDRNCVSATISPATEVNHPAILAIPEQPQFMQFVNQVVTREESSECKLTVTNNDNTYTVSGCVHIKDAPKTLAMAIKNPRFNVQTAITFLLNKNHISHQGIEFKKTEKLPPLLASADSSPLPVLINTMLKDSDNTIANSLFKKIGAVFANASGTWVNGHDALHDILMKSLGLSIPATTFIDGAGGSRYNFVTPKQIMALLHGIYAAKDNEAFIAALPIAGVDGTIKNRMQEKNLRGNVFAKTGTETAVTALSGYLHTKKKHTLVFSIMINSFIDLPSKYQVLEDKICAAAVETG